MLDGVLEGLDSGRTVQLIGEPGIGKTRLVTEVLERSRDLGYVALAGRGAEFEREVPFSVFADALEDHLASLDMTSLDGLDAERLGELAVVFPSISSQVDDGVEELQLERYRFHRAVRALLEELAGHRPLVLALDDLHWADTASVELVRHLLRHQPEAPVLFLLALRHRQAPQELRAALDSAAREGTSDRIELAALERTEAEELLGEALDRPTREMLCRASGGNPFYLKQLARAAQRGTDAPASGRESQETDVPQAVTASIIDEIAVLS
ncbi:hypothetical protein LCGC14_3139760, partial [marine sediment metagenome]